MGTDVKALWKRETGGWVQSVAISSDGEHIVAGSSDGHVYFFRRDGRLIWRRKVVEGSVHRLGLSKGAQYIVAGTFDGCYVTLFDRDGGRIWQKATEGYTWGADISADGKFVCGGSLDNRVFFWDREGRLLWTFRAEKAIRGVSVSENGDFIFAGSDDGHLYAIERSGQLKWKYKTGGSVWSAPAITPDNKNVVAGSVDQNLYFFDIDGDLPWNHSANGPVSSVAVSSDGNRVAFGTKSGQLCLLNGEGKHIWNLQGHKEVFEVKLSSDGEYMVARTEDNLLALFDSKGEVLYEYKADDFFHSVAMTPNGRYFAGACHDRYVYVFENPMSPPEDEETELAGITPAIVAKNLSRVFASAPYNGLCRWFDDFDYYLNRGRWEVCEKLIREIRDRDYPFSVQEMSYVKSREAALWLKKGIARQKVSDYDSAEQCYRRSLQIHENVGHGPSREQTELAIRSLEEERSSGVRDPLLDLIEKELNVFGGGGPLLCQRLGARLHKEEQIQIVRAAIRYGLPAPLFQLARSDDLHVRMIATSALARFTGIEEADVLMENLEDSNWFVRWQAASALIEMKNLSEESVGRIAEKFESETDPEVKRTLAMILSKKGGEETAPALLTGLQDPDPDVRWMSAFALSEIGDARALPKMAETEDGKTIWEQSVSEAVKAAMEKIQERYLPKIVKFEAARLIDGSRPLLPSSQHWSDEPVMCRARIANASDHTRLTLSCQGPENAELFRAELPYSDLLLQTAQERLIRFLSFLSAEAEGGVFRKTPTDGERQKGSIESVLRGHGKSESLDKGFSTADSTSGDSNDAEGYADTSPARSILRDAVLRQGGDESPALVELQLSYPCYRDISSQDILFFMQPPDLAKSKPGKYRISIEAYHADYEEGKYEAETHADLAARVELPDRIYGKDGKKMLLVPEGPMIAGEGQRAYLLPFHIDRAAVTCEQYGRFCAETGHLVPEHWEGTSPPENTKRLPVVNISVEDARAYAKWAEKELPTELEWEKACRGDHGNVFPWGNEWDPSRVSSQGARFRKKFDREYDELNSDYWEGVGMFVLKRHRFQLPPHPNTEFDEEKFLALVEGSLSLTIKEKKRVVEAVGRITQEQIEELFKIFEEEKKKFTTLDKMFETNKIFEKERKKFTTLDKMFEANINNLRKDFHSQIMGPELQDMYIQCAGKTPTNLSPYGVSNMTGLITEMVVSDADGSVLLKGGSWFSADPENDCRTFQRIPLSAWMQKKRMDVGFRCVKPVLPLECRIGPAKKASQIDLELPGIMGDASQEMSGIIRSFGVEQLSPSSKYIRIPDNELAFDETEFLRLMASSISLTKDEKIRIIEAIPQISQQQLDELIAILENEKSQFCSLDASNKDQLREVEKNFAEEWEEVCMHFKSVGEAGAEENDSEQNERPEIADEGQEPGQSPLVSIVSETVMSDDSDSANGNSMTSEIAAAPVSGGRVKLPDHELEFDEGEFLSLLSESIIMTKEQKIEAINGISTMSQEKMDFLLGALKGEVSMLSLVNLLPEDQLEEAKNQLETVKKQRAGEWEEICGLFDSAEKGDVKN